MRSAIDSWDDNDDDREASLAVEATSPFGDVPLSDVADPADFERESLVDPAYAGRAAFNWDWSMSPAQRAKVISDRTFSVKMNELADAMSTAAVHEPVDPVAAAQDILMKRYRG